MARFFLLLMNLRLPFVLDNPCLQTCAVFQGDQHLHLSEDQLLMISCDRRSLLMMADVDHEESMCPEEKYHQQIKLNVDKEFVLFCTNLWKDGEDQ